MEEHHLRAVVIRAFPEVELQGGLIYFLKSNFMPDAVDDICCRKKINILIISRLKMICYRLITKYISAQLAKRVPTVKLQGSFCFIQFTPHDLGKLSSVKRKIIE